MHGRQRVGGMNGGNTHVECCVRRHTGQATLLALRDTNRDRPARDRARPQRLPAPGLTRPFPWQEAGDLKTLASMQARPVTPHVAISRRWQACRHAQSHRTSRKSHWRQGGAGQSMGHGCTVWKRTSTPLAPVRTCCRGGRGSEIFLPLLPPCSPHPAPPIVSVT